MEGKKEKVRQEKAKKEQEKEDRKEMAERKRQKCISPAKKYHRHNENACPERRKKIMGKMRKRKEGKI